MAAQLSLARPTRRRLVRLDRKTGNPDLRIRCRIVLKVAAGMSCAEAARALGCAPSTAARSVARFRWHGEAGLIDGRSDNGRRKVDADVRGAIRAILARRAPAWGFTRPTWTLEAITQVIERVQHLQLSVGHLWKVLKGMRVRWRRPRPVVACPWKTAARERRLAELERLAQTPRPGEAMFYADEVDIHLNPKIGPDWMLPGIRHLVVTPGKNEKRYLAGAYDPRQKRLIYVAGERKASWLFLSLLRALLDACVGVRVIHVILDNYIIHKSHLTLAWLRERGVRLRLHFLPPYCPDSNRIERLWWDLHANVTRNHMCRTMRELMQAVHRYLAHRFELVQVVAYAA